MTPVLILRLPCDCVLTESVNGKNTKTKLDLWRSKDCKKRSHFASDTGWPQFEDAYKIEVLQSK